MVPRRRLIVAGASTKDISGNILWRRFGHGFAYETFRTMTAIFAGKSISENKS